MQRTKMLREIENTNQPYFISTNVIRTHKGIVQKFKFKAKKSKCRGYRFSNE